MTFCDLCGDTLTEEEKQLNKDREFDIDLCEDCMQEGERLMMKVFRRLLSRRGTAGDEKQYSWERED